MSVNDIVPRSPPAWHRAAALIPQLWRWVLAPPRCAACDEPLPRVAAFCVACAEAVVEAPAGELSGLDGFAAFGLYGGPLAVAIRRLKYEGRTDLAVPLGGLTMRASARFENVEAMVPVPLHPVRLAERGFNQSALIARALRGRGWGFSPGWLRRARETPAQAGLSREERAKNLEGDVFAARSAVAGRSILLVDDVATTGATLRACAQALRLRGAKRVQALVLAFREGAASEKLSEHSSPWWLDACLEGR